MPYTQDFPGLSRTHFELRIAGDPLSLVNALRRTVHQANPNVTVSDVSAQAARINQDAAHERDWDPHGARGRGKTLDGLY